MNASDAGTLVLLDDNLITSSGLAAALKRAGHPVVLLSDARDAPARAAAAAPRLVIVNLTSLSWDANALIRALKSETALSHVPILGFAGHKEVERISTAREAGCDHVVANSAISADPGAVIRQILDRHDP
jgi:DNA-binding response OmpR family regulator